MTRQKIHSSAHDEPKWTSKQERDWYTLLHPETWPHWPGLPLKRRTPDGRREVAVALATHHFHHAPMKRRMVKVAYNTTIFDTAIATVPWVDVYPSDLIDDGWEVD